MADFRVFSHAYTFGYIDISPQKAAPIMGISKKMATNYATGKSQPDKARLRLLEAHFGKKIIPQDAPIWYDSEDNEIRTDTGHGFTVEELNQYAWLRSLQSGIISDLKSQLDALKGTIQPPQRPADVIQLKDWRKPQ